MSWNRQVLRNMYSTQIAIEIIRLEHRSRNENLIREYIVGEITELSSGRLNLDTPA